MEAGASSPTGRRVSWIYAILPMNIASGPISTFVQLYLIQLNGVTMGTVYIAAALTVFNGVSIPAAMIWGLATDRLHSRKLIIATSYAASAIMLTSFIFTDSSYGVIIVYAAISFMSSASATPLNLLIMETEPKSRWAKVFASLSMVSSVGVTGGLVLSALWAVFLPLLWLVIPLAVFALASTILAVLMIQEPPFVFERQMVILSRPSFFQRLLQFPLMFLTIPRPADFMRVFKGLRSELTSYVPLLYISIVCFYLSSGIFNTSLVPALSDRGLSQSTIYFVTFVAMAVQILSFRYAGAYLEKRSLTSAAVKSLVLRGSSYALLGVAVILVSGTWFTVPALVFYPLAAGAAYGIYYTSSNTMIFNSVRSRNHGSVLGVYSAVVGVSTMMGSIISGFTSFYLGFHVTFILAGVILGVAAYITSRLAGRGPAKELLAPR